MKEIIVHCSTKEEWNKVQEKMFKEGYMWRGGKIISSDEWSCYGSGSCLSAESDGEIYYSPKNYYEKEEHKKVTPAQEYLEPKTGGRQLTHSEFLAYIKEHGPTKARTVDKGTIREGVWEIKNWGGDKGIGLNYLPWYYNNENKCKFELVEESQPFEDKSASEQGEYFVVEIGDETDAGNYFTRGDIIKKVGYKTYRRLSDGEKQFKSDEYIRPATQSEIDEVLGKKERIIVYNPRRRKLEDIMLEASIDYYKGIDYCEKPTNQSIIKKTMNKVTKFIKALALSADDKLLRENGLMDEYGNFTQSYHDVKELITDQEYKEKVVAQLKATLEAEKEK